MKKALVVFYSRSGATRKVAEDLARGLKADIEEIKTRNNYKGVLGYLRAGRQATQKKPAEIISPIKKPANYNLIIVGTPVWGWNVSSPVRAYLAQNKNKFKKLAFFCTMSGSGDKRTFQEMEKICGQKPLTSLSFCAKEISKNEIKEKIDKYIKIFI